jgi:hypothetical protein
MVMVRGLFILHLCAIRASCSPFNMHWRITQKKHNALHDLIGKRWTILLLFVRLLHVHVIWKVFLCVLPLLIIYNPKFQSIVC